MGHSKSIQELRKQEKEFQNYLDEIQEKLELRANDAVSQMHKQRDDYYSNNRFNRIEYMAGKKIDFSHSESWSLDRINNMIKSISVALLGMKTNSDDVAKDVSNGIEIKPIPKGAMESIEDLKLYFAGKTFEIISNILSSFSVGSSTSFMHDSRHEPLGAGFHLFITVVTDSFKSNSFFRNEVILESLFIFEINYSLEEAQKLAEIGAVKLYSDQLVTFISKKEKLLEDFGNDLISIEEYSQKEEILDSFILKYQEQIASLKHEQSLKLKTLSSHPNNDN